ncbi:MAG TPA: LiaF domain-containing protein [Bacteroidota bacterium]|nr:LiaF domain-containing protein [Bacteroidota bacterium]
MRFQRFLYFIPILLTIPFLIFTGFLYLTADRYSKELPLSHERELKVDIEAGLGNVNIGRGTSATLLNLVVDADKYTELSNCFDYTLDDDIGYLNINTSEVWEKKSREKKKKHSVHIGDVESITWDMRFTDAIPISFDMELGLGKGDLDFTGLVVKDLNLSLGASSVSLKFDQPNKTVIKDLTIEAGLCKFQGVGLGDANFNHLKFEGGVGKYSLDFGGHLAREVDVDIELGLGALTVTIPEDVGVKVYCEKNWVTHLDFDRSLEEEEEHTYYSPNYRTSKGKINMNIEAGLGSVKIRHD